MNEEEIKNNIIVPYLLDLGFTSDEVSFESSFHIKLGRYDNLVKGDVKKGYLDILCKKDNRNLFVIEVKSESKKITSDDISQGVSYARLLDNIAPFVIITNGKDTQVVDSITKKIINGTNISTESEFWKNDCILATDVELKLRYDTFKNFISLSSDNFSIFVNEQVRKNMKPIIGSLENNNAKFLQEIYIAREGLEQEFSYFMKSSFSVFAIIGEAGVGKTNSICDLCLRILKDSYALFYNSPLISQSLINEISLDFNMFFSATQSSEKTLSEILSIADRFDKPLVIFIDAIDEVQIPTFKQELGNIVKTIQGNSHVKICLSCKSSLWMDVLYIGVNESYTKAQVYKPADKRYKNPVLPGVFLRPFTKDELTDILPKYKAFFATMGNIPSLIMKSIENGLFLRIYFQTYQDKHIPPENIDFNFFEAYLAYKAMAENVSKESLIYMLSLIAELILSKDTSDYYKEIAVTIEEVKGVLQLRPSEEVPSLLFSQNLLLKSTDEGNPIIAFYDSTIRDYILVKHSYKLDSLNERSFNDVLPNFFRGMIGQSAISFYLLNADVIKNQFINNFIQGKRKNFLLIYSEVLHKYFPTIRDCFDPYTQDEIGMIIPSGRKKFAYALIPTKEVLIDKRIIEIDDDLFSFNNRDLSSMYKVSIIHYGPLPIFTDNLEQLITAELFKQLSVIIKKESLDESASLSLLSEKVINIVYFYARELGYEIKSRAYPVPNYQEILPIELNDIKKKINIFFAEQYYTERNVQDLQESGKIQSHEGSLSYSTDQLDWDWINTQVVNAIENRIEVPTPQSGGDSPPFVFLNDLLNILLQNGYKKVEDLKYLPLINRMIEKIDRSNNPNKYFLKEGSVKELIEALFSQYDKAYKELVDSCFPTLKNDLEFYSTLPHQFYIYRSDTIDKLDTCFYYAYKQSNNDRTTFTWMNTSFKNEDFEEIGFETLYSTHLNDLLRVRHSKRMLKWINTRDVDNHLILREQVYKILNNDLKKLCEVKGINARQEFR